MPIVKILVQGRVTGQLSHNPPYKTTGDISVSPVQFFLKKLSPVLSCSKIGRPSFYTCGGRGVLSMLSGEAQLRGGVMAKIFVVMINQLCSKANS